MLTVLAEYKDAIMKFEEGSPDLGKIMLESVVSELEAALEENPRLAEGEFEKILFDSHSRLLGKQVAKKKRKEREAAFASAPLKPSTFAEVSSSHSRTTSDRGAETKAGGIGTTGEGGGTPRSARRFRDSVDVTTLSPEDKKELEKQQVRDRKGGLRKIPAASFVTTSTTAPAPNSPASPSTSTSASITVTSARALSTSTPARMSDERRSEREKKKLKMIMYEGEPLFQGYANKRGVFNPAYRKRYMVAYRNCVNFFRNKKVFLKKPSKPRTQIQSAEVTSVRHFAPLDGKENCIIFVTSARTFYVQPLDNLAIDPCIDKCVQAWKLNETEDRKTIVLNIHTLVGSKDNQEESSSLSSSSSSSSSTDDSSSESSSSSSNSLPTRTQSSNSLLDDQGRRKGSSRGGRRQKKPKMSSTSSIPSLPVAPSAEAIAKKDNSPPSPLTKKSGKGEKSEGGENEGVGAKKSCVVVSSDAEVYMEGWAFKRGVRNPAFKKRYMVVYETCVNFFPDSSKHRKHPNRPRTQIPEKEVAKVSLGEESAARGKTINLFTPSRVFVVASAGTPSIEEWHLSLQHAWGKSKVPPLTATSMFTLSLPSKIDEEEEEPEEDEKKVFLPYTPAEIVTDADIYTEFEDHLIMKNPNDLTTLETYKILQPVSSDPEFAIDAETGRKVAQRIGFSFSGTTPNPGLSHLYLESLSNIEKPFIDELKSKIAVNNYSPKLFRTLFNALEYELTQQLEEFKFREMKQGEKARVKARKKQKLATPRSANGAKKLLSPRGKK